MKWERISSKRQNVRWFISFPRETELHRTSLPGIIPSLGILLAAALQCSLPETLLAEDPAASPPPLAASTPPSAKPSPAPAKQKPKPNGTGIGKQKQAVKETAAIATTRPTPASLFESPTPLKTQSTIDRLVMERLRPLGVRPTLCSDAVFVRRAYLDATGVLPTAAEAKAFINDPDTDTKRKRLIDRLLASDDFAIYWGMKWGDLLRIKAEFPVNLWPNAAQLYHRWVVSSLQENKPYDQFVREMLTASGSNFRVGPVNFYRAMSDRSPEGIASIVALTFLGMRTESWPAERLAGMSGFFAQVGYKPTSEWKEEYVFWDPAGTHTIAGSLAPGRAKIEEIGTAATDTAEAKPFPSSAVFPDGTKVALSPDRDPREVFADWLLTAENPWFARSLSNRVWSWLLGRGIVHEADDLRPDNPPSNPELLAYLEREFVVSKYNLHHLFRLILNSETYQFSSLAKSSKPEVAAQFGSYPLRRLEAEVLIDAINGITGTSELYTSPIPEPFTYIPQGQPSIAIGDGSITSPFLALFGRSARATGTEDERPNQVVSAQWLHLLNSSHIQEKLEKGPALKAILQPKRPPREKITDLYLTILSRYPTPEEAARAREYCGVGSDGKPGKGARTEHWGDLAWALLNSNEFLFRH